MIICKTECCYYNDKTSVAFISKLIFETRRPTLTGDHTTGIKKNMSVKIRFINSSYRADLETEVNATFYQSAAYMNCAISETNYTWKLVFLHPSNSIALNLLSSLRQSRARMKRSVLKAVQNAVIT